MSKKCMNCGHINDERSYRCEKCSVPLTGSMVAQHRDSGRLPQSLVSSTDTEETNETSFGTIRESENWFEEYPDGEKKMCGTVCPNCKYYVRPQMNVCPNCGTHLKKEPKQESQPSHQRKCSNCGGDMAAWMKFCPNCGMVSREKTIFIGGQSTPSFTLKPVFWNNEDAECKPLKFYGDNVVLNRANTIPDNMSITSQEQAVLFKENDQWYVEDKSEHHSTFVRACGKVELQDGDILVLGDSFFEFKDKSNHE